MKVLIVDDSAETRGLIRALLENKGHEVVGEEEDGAGALRAFAELRPEVVLLDIIMSGMSGIEALKELRKLDPVVKVIMVTAVEQDTINRQLHLFGADGIIYKPFSAYDFEKTFLEVIRKKPEDRVKSEAVPEAPRDKPAAAEKNDTITRLAAGGLSKCMLKTSDASSWAWELCDLEVFSGKVPEAVRKADFGRSVAAVQVYVRGYSPFSAAMLMRSEDIGHISSCFMNGPLYRTGAVAELEEGLVIEIGNIILNAMVNPLINALSVSAIASVPMLIKGGPGAVAAGLSASLNPKLDLRIISASLAMRRDGRLARAGVLGVLPEELAAELERWGAGDAAV